MTFETPKIDYKITFHQSKTLQFCIPSPFFISLNDGSYSLPETVSIITPLVLPPRLFTHCSDTAVMTTAVPSAVAPSRSWGVALFWGRFNSITPSWILWRYVVCGRPLTYTTRVFLGTRWSWRTTGTSWSCRARSGPPGSSASSAATWQVRY